MTIAQSAWVRSGLGATKPTVVASTTDQNVMQLMELINEEGQELCASYNWQVMTKEATFTSVATQLQGVITTIAGADFNFIVNETMWDRTTRRPVFGPKDSAEWQWLMAQLMQGPWIQWRIRGNQILFLPTNPPAGDAIYFEWCSKNWATTSDGLTAMSSFSNDSDVALLDERLITLGAIWRFREAKGLPYDKELEKYDNAVADAKARDGGKPRLNLAGSSPDIYPGIMVAAGSWPISGEPS